MAKFANSYNNFSRRAGYVSARVSKSNFSKKVKGGGSVTLHAAKGTAGVSVYKKMYKTANGARRILQITTIKRVIKGKS